MPKRIERTKKSSAKVKDDNMKGAGRSFIEALLFIGILVILVIAAVFLTTLVTDKTDTSTESVVIEKQAAKLPWDVPEYQGGIQTRYSHSGNRSIYEYDLPQGSVGSVQAFFKERLESNEWVRQSRSSQYVSEYVDAVGKRDLTITLSYRTGKVHMKMEIVTIKQ